MVKSFFSFAESRSTGHTLGASLYFLHGNGGVEEARGTVMEKGSKVGVTRLESGCHSFGWRPRWQCMRNFNKLGVQSVWRIDAHEAEAAMGADNLYSQSYCDIFGRATWLSQQEEQCTVVTRCVLVEVMFWLNKNGTPEFSLVYNETEVMIRLAM
jgi:hypothetical protein